MCVFIVCSRDIFIDHSNEAIYFYLFFILVEQLTNVVLYSSDTYTKAVSTEEFG